MLIIESWRFVRGFEGLYEVSDQGRVRSIKGRHGQGMILSPKLPDNPREYMAVSLHKDGKRIRRCVHALVAEAFLPHRPSPKHQMRHLDGNRAANYADNLAWGTAKENAMDRDRHGRTARGSTHGCWVDGRWRELRGLSDKKRIAALKARNAQR